MPDCSGSFKQLKYYKICDTDDSFGIQRENEQAMETVLISPAKASVLGIPTVVFSVVIPLVGIFVFVYIILRRLVPLLKAAPAHPIDRLQDRILQLLKVAILQYRQPRYPIAGIIHIFIFAGFVILSLRSITIIMLGIFDGFHLPGLDGAAGNIYATVKDISERTLKCICLMVNT